MGSQVSIGEQHGTRLGEQVDAHKEPGGRRSRKKYTRDNNTRNGSEREIQRRGHRKKKLTLGIGGVVLTK